MAESIPSIESLIKTYLQDQASPEQVKELIDRANAGGWSTEFETVLDKFWDESHPSVSLNREEILQKIFTKAKTWENQNKVISIQRIKRWVAAASILLFIAATVFYFVSRKSDDGSPKKEIAKQEIPAPDRNRASITLADGRTIYLDSAENGQLVNQNDVILSKTEDGKVIYKSSQLAASSSQLTYNTLSNPRGSKVIDLILSDGSHVWLNSGSSITYPVAFVENVGNVRNVKMSGEAYFEVAHDGNSPFVVEANGVITKVLGTHFNVNAYDDEDAIKVTLLEGKVQVENKSATSNLQSAILKPGEQAVFTIHDSRLTANSGADLDQVMAWKNGNFYFEKADVKTILRQISRWYDVEVVYEGSVSNRTFFGIVSRSSSLLDVLKILKANDMKFRIEGKKLFVTSA